MGSEMCIRDRAVGADRTGGGRKQALQQPQGGHALHQVDKVRVLGCLLYTSDAADERSSVDLGGRRILKKKKTADIGQDGTWVNRDN